MSLTCAQFLATKLSSILIFSFFKAFLFYQITFSADWINFQQTNIHGKETNNPIAGIWLKAKGTWTWRALSTRIIAPKRQRTIAIPFKTVKNKRLNRKSIEFVTKNLISYLPFQQSPRSQFFDSFHFVLNWRPPWLSLFVLNCLLKLVC